MLHKVTFHQSKVALWQTIKIAHTWLMEHWLELVLLLLLLTLTIRLHANLPLIHKHGQTHSQERKDVSFRTELNDLKSGNKTIPNGAGNAPDAMIQNTAEPMKTSINCIGRSRNSNLKYYIFTNNTPPSTNKM